MKAGAVDFLPKPFRDQDMIDAVSIAIERDRQRRAADGNAAPIRNCFATLSSREQQVMMGVTAGKKNKQVAGDLGLSEITVKIHRGAAMRKMCARTLPDLVRMADRLKLRASQPSNSPLLGRPPKGATIWSGIIPPILAPFNEGTVLAALDDILPFPDLALPLVLLESIAVVAVTRFVDKLLDEQGGDLLREGIRALSEALTETEVWTPLVAPTDLKVSTTPWCNRFTFALPASATKTMSAVTEDQAF
jgi:DNA-binding CsgD family transcriptional regulator